MASLPRLSRDVALSPAWQERPDLEMPPPTAVGLPERAVQFGTGAFLRGFVDYFVDAANRQGSFAGSIVAVGSTESGRDTVLNEQDGLYTLAVRGLENGVPVERLRVVASLSRALSAVSEWPAVLAVARDPNIALVFSNTTEVGIALDDTDRADLDPPRSFPGKLTRFLYERATAFDYDPAAGVVVLPCELLENNGAQLGEIVRTLAGRWQLGLRFERWLLMRSRGSATRSATPTASSRPARRTGSLPSRAMPPFVLASVSQTLILVLSSRPPSPITAS